MIERAIEADPDNLIVLVAIVGGLGIAVVAIVGGLITGLVKSKNRQKTAQEIAAYVAEGSMTVEQGEALLRASAESKDGC